MRTALSFVTFAALAAACTEPTDTFGSGVPEGGDSAFLGTSLVSESAMVDLGDGNFQQVIILDIASAFNGA